MIDTGTTNNFVAKAKAKRLSLQLEKDSKDANRIKTANFEAQPIKGVERACR